MYTVIAHFVMPRCAFPLPFALPGLWVYNKGMPTYVYQCNLCDKMVEVKRSYYLGDVIEPVCDCGDIMHRVYEAPAVVYKGKGFYSTDKREVKE